MAYPNGEIPLSDLVMTTAGVRLRSDAAASYERLSKEFNKVHGPMYVSDGYRARNDGGNFSQEAIFLDRYRPQASGNGPFNDVRWYNGKRYVRHKSAAAAVPGTSNHGWGVAADFASGINASFTSPQYRWMAQNGPSHGWTNTEGRGINEPWHWVYNPANDQYRNSGGGESVVTPTPPSEEDDMTPDQAAQLKYVFDALAQGQSGVRPAGHVLIQLGRIEAEAKSANANTGPITRNGKSVSLRQEIVDTGTLVRNIPAAVWGYVNPKLEKTDAYAILCSIRDKVFGK